MEATIITLLVILIVFVFALIAAVIWLALKQTKTEDLQASISIFGDIRETLGEMRTASLQVQEVGQGVAQLHNILAVPRVRGMLGEQMLEQLLQQMLPSAYYQTQYELRNNSRVDAAIFLSEGVVPVDSKFPLERFRAMHDLEGNERERARRDFIRACKKHIDDIASKYICPEENRFDFALMYIPAENVYYEFMSGAEQDNAPSTYAMQKRVFPVSPSSFYAYLSVIVLGLRGMYVEKHAREIVDKIAHLEHQFTLLTGDFQTLDTHLQNASNKWSEIRRKACNVEDDLRRINKEIEMPIE